LILDDPAELSETGDRPPLGSAWHEAVGSSPACMRRHQSLRFNDLLSFGLCGWHLMA